MPSLTVEQLLNYKKIVSSGEDFKIFIETGTYHGECIHAMENSNLFEELHTIELHEETYRQTKNWFNKFTNSKVNFYLGNSKNVLPEICKNIKNNAIFWLDAHQHHVTIPNEADHKNGIFAPLVDELVCINTAFSFKTIVIIDDINSVGLESLQHITVSQIIDILKSRTIKIHQDQNRLVFLLKEKK